MASWRGSTNTVCPFYVREATYEVSCEGINGCECLKICFSSSEEKTEWQEEVCATHDFMLCPLAAVIAYEYKEV